MCVVAASPRPKTANTRPADPHGLPGQPPAGAGPVTATAPKKRQRQRDLPKHVRWCKGGSYQARPWVGPEPDANVNLGLYRTELYGNDHEAAINAAAYAARTFLKMLAGPPVGDVWEVIQRLQRTRRFGLPVVPAHVLPPCVRRVYAADRETVTGYVAVSRRCGVRVEVGPYADPGEAYRALKAACAGVVPSRRDVRAAGGRAGAGTSS